MEQAQTQFEKFFSYGSIGADLKLDLDLFDGIDSFDKEKELQVFNLGGEEQESLRVVLNTTTFRASGLDVENETDATDKIVVSATLILNTIDEDDDTKLLVTSFGLTISQ
ncbi:MAG: hypothetical protein PHV79_02460, partial [Clostridia bacterium]|nr:hypothetical protein [Clostridia bacterium]